MVEGLEEVEEWEEVEVAPDLVQLAVMDIVLAGGAVHVTLVQLHPQPGEGGGIVGGGGRVGEGVGGERRWKEARGGRRGRRW